MNTIIKEKLLDSIKEIDSLSNSTDSESLERWQRNTRTIIRKGFTMEDSDEFDKINYYPLVYVGGHEPDTLAYRRIGLNSARAMLHSLIAELDLENELSTPTPEGTPPRSDLESTKLICDRFHRVCKQLQSRYNSRQTLTINDEYDVQDLFHALLLVHFDDIRKEEWTPSYAGGSSRVDFLLKNEQIVIETKKTRESLRDKELGTQLIIDIAKYKSHSNCKLLVCFVYDPQGLINNPTAIENDLSGTHDGLPVHVLIRPSH